MKKILLLIVSIGFLGINNSNAQMLSVGSVAPDFTLTDINNVTHNLYNYTDSGYTVIIDVSATWCGPCWDVHQSHVFDSLTLNYGTNGAIDSGKIKVIFVEGDTTTNSQDLSGQTSGSAGDWVTGAQYPIVDLASNAFKTTYPIAGYPSFYVICPNRSITFSGAGYSTAMLTQAFWVDYMNDCPVKVNGLNAGLIKVDTESESCQGTSTSLDVTLQNLGTSPITSATVEALDGSNVLATTNWTGNLNTYDRANVNIGNYTFQTGSTNVTYKVTLNGDIQTSDDELYKTISALVSNYYTVTLQVKTDQYPGEIKWTVKNSSNNVIQTKTYVGNGNNAGGVDAGKVFDEVLTLNANECYTIEVEDSYGDGLYGLVQGQTAADTGYIRLYDGLSSGTLMKDYGAGYGNGFVAVFKTGSAVSVDDIISTEHFNVYPNPVTNLLNIQFDLTENSPVTLNLMDLNGKVILTQKIANTNSVSEQLNVQDLVRGVYNLNIVTAKQSKNVKLLVTD